MKNAIKHITAAALLFAFIIGVPASTIAQKKNENGAAAAPRFGNVDAISRSEMRDWLTVIASDEMEGRDTPSKGLDLAAKYISEHLAKWKIRPGGDEGDYFQKFPLQQSKVVPQETKLDLAGQNYEYGKDFLSTVMAAKIAPSQVVFAGYGWVIKSKNINAYQGIDVKRQDRCRRQQSSQGDHERRPEGTARRRLAVTRLLRTNEWRESRR